MSELPKPNSDHLTDALAEPSTTPLPCPLCGGSDVYVAWDEYGSGGQGVGPAHVGCSRCTLDMTDLKGETLEDAIAAWNRRAVEADEAAKGRMNNEPQQGIGESRREPLPVDEIHKLCGVSTRDLMMKHMAVYCARAIERAHGITPQAGKESGE